MLHIKDEYFPDRCDTQYDLSKNFFCVSEEIEIFIDKNRYLKSPCEI